MSEGRQRWRLVFRREGPAMYLSHLDAIHSWERALRRGRIPVATSEGFNPRPKLAFAAPLQLGMLAEHELADLILAQRLTAPDLRARLRDCLPPGYRVTDLFDVWVGSPAIAPQLAAADYRLDLLGVETGLVQPGIDRLLAAASLPRQRRREARVIRYDLRPLIIRLEILQPGHAGGGTGSPESAETPDGRIESPRVDGPATRLWMRLRHSQDGGTGRAEEVVAALADEVGLRFSWTGGDDEEAEPARAPGTEPPGAASDVAADSILEPEGDRPTQVEVVMPVRERLWLVEELEQRGLVGPDWVARRPASV